MVCLWSRCGSCLGKDLPQSPNSSSLLHVSRPLHKWGSHLSFLPSRLNPLTGFPIVQVFTLKPLEFGKPNTLVCFISNLFPPTLTVEWQHQSAPVEGVGPTFVSAVDGLTFQAFSYLNFTPESSDLFSCIVTHEIDGYTAIAFWGETLLPGSLVPLWGRREGDPWEGFFLHLALVQAVPALRRPQSSQPRGLPCRRQPRHPQPGLGANQLPFFSSAPERAAL